MKKNIVIVDIDGTISKIGERLKYLQQEPRDWDSFYNDCFDDTPIPEMVELVSNLINAHCGDHSIYEVVFCTGRREKSREKTTKWFAKICKWSFVECRLLMRKDGDLRSDTVVKPELVHKAGIKFEEIAFVLEDRAKMAKAWRSLGVRCLQVDEGEF